MVDNEAIYDIWCRRNNKIYYPLILGLQLITTSFSKNVSFEINVGI